MRAIFSDCGDYRYRLERDIAQEGPLGAFIWVNPSKASHLIDDPSSKKGIGFATRLGWRGYILGNEFAWKATDIHDLRLAADPIGPDNDRHLEQIMRDADVHVVGCGTLGKLPQALRGRWKEVVQIADRVGCKLHCIGLCDDGHPKHPLMTGYATPMTEWATPWFANRAQPDGVVGKPSNPHGN